MHTNIAPEVVIGSRFLEKVLPRIAEARDTIDIMVFDWRIEDTPTDSPVQHLVSALHDATTRGVRVRILVNSEKVRIILKRFGFHVRVVYTRKLMHCKFMLIDEVLLITGSHNYTLSAFTLNHELSVIVYLEKPQNDANLYFANLWGV